MNYVLKRKELFYHCTAGEIRDAGDNNFFTPASTTAPPTFMMRISAILFQISIPVKPCTIVADELLTLVRRNLALLNRLRYPYLQTSDEFLRVVLNIFEHIGNGLSVDGLVYCISLFIDGYMHRIRVAEEIVHIAENLLICSDEEDAYVIMLTISDSVEWQIVGLLPSVDIGTYLSVRVAGDVLQLCRTGRCPTSRACSGRARSYRNICQPSACRDCVSRRAHASDDVRVLPLRG